MEGWEADDLGIKRPTQPSRGNLRMAVVFNSQPFGDCGHMFAFGRDAMAHFSFSVPPLVTAAQRANSLFFEGHQEHMRQVHVVCANVPAFRHL